MRRVRAAALALLLPLAPASGGLGADPQERNGFPLAPASIPAEEIVSGGPPRDGIPALVDPKVVAVDRAPWPDEMVVLGVVHGGEARAYPLGILSWHELVNDALGGAPILVSYSPLCGTSLAFDRSVGGSARRFGVSGLLFRANLLLYDRESESLWSQISALAVTGPALGKRLRVLRSEQVAWGEWKRRHPGTTVLSPDTGHKRNYLQSPYEKYALSPDLFFPVPVDQRYHPKMPTLGLRLASGPARAYPGLELVRAGGAVKEQFEGRHVRVSYDPEGQFFQVEAPDDVEVIEGYWFAWAAFHPVTSVFVAK